MLKLTRDDLKPQPLLCDAEWKIVAQRLRLSPRELQIVQQIMVDKKECAIASQLCISVHTVHTHLKRIYWKLNVRSRVELVIRIFQEYVAQLREGGNSPQLTRRLIARRAAA
jgi:DNA-binding NarL/FixJ family response regulator